MDNRSSNSPEFSHHHVAQLDDLRTGLARLEGRAESFATKTEVENVRTKISDVRKEIVEAKYAMIVVWGGAGLVVVSAIVTAVLRFWPQSG